MKRVFCDIKKYFHTSGMLGESFTMLGKTCVDFERQINRFVELPERNEFNIRTF